MATVVPQGLAMICEAWPQIEYLSSLGRLKEDYMMSYAGKERHVETEQLSRPSQLLPHRSRHVVLCSKASCLFKLVRSLFIGQPPLTAVGLPVIIEYGRGSLASY